MWNENLVFSPKFHISFLECVELDFEVFHWIYIACLECGIEFWSFSLDLHSIDGLEWIFNSFSWLELQLRVLF